MEIKANIPVLLTDFVDYHEIENSKDLLKAIFPDLKIEEISPEKYGFDFPGHYTAIVYIRGNKPDPKEIKIMLSNAEFYEMEN